MKIAFGFVVSFWLAIPFVALADDLLPPQIEHEPCENYPAGQDHAIKARFFDEVAIFDPKLLYRTEATADWQNLPFLPAENGIFVATVPSVNLKGRLQYFIEVFDENGNGPARFGGPEVPVTLQPSVDWGACAQVMGDEIDNDDPDDGDDQGVLSPPVSSPPVSSPPVSSPPTLQSKPPATAVASPTPTGPAAINPGARATKPSATKQMTPTSPGPPPPKGTCERDDRPVYCSPWLWAGIGGALAVGAGVGVGVWLGTSGSGGSEPVGPPSRVAISVGGPSAIGALPR